MCCFGCTRYKLIFYRHMLVILDLRKLSYALPGCNIYVQWHTHIFICTNIYIYMRRTASKMYWRLECLSPTQISGHHLESDGYQVPSRYFQMPAAVRSPFPSARSWYIVCGAWAPPVTQWAPVDVRVVGQNCAASAVEAKHVLTPKVRALFSHLVRM